MIGYPSAAGPMATNTVFLKDFSTVSQLLYPTSNGVLSTDSKSTLNRGQEWTKLPKNSLMREKLLKAFLKFDLPKFDLLKSISYKNNEFKIEP